MPDLTRPTNGLTNNILIHSQQPTPEVGMGATECWWTDRHAGTIVAVAANGKSLEWQQDKATRADTHGVSDCQSYTYKSNPEAVRKTYTLRKNGRWVLKGDSMTGLTLALGRRDEYHDYGF